MKIMKMICAVVNAFSLVKILSFKCIVAYLKPNAATFVKVEFCTRKTLTTTTTFFQIHSLMSVTK